MTTTLETIPQTSEVFLRQVNEHSHHLITYPFDSMKTILEEKKVAPELHILKEFKEFSGYSYTNSYVLHHERGATVMHRSRVQFGGQDVVCIIGDYWAVEAAQRDILSVANHAKFHFEEISEEEGKRCLK